MLTILKGLLILMGVGLVLLVGMLSCLILFAAAASWLEHRRYTRSTRAVRLSAWRKQSIEEKE